MQTKEEIWSEEKRQRLRQERVARRKRQQRKKRQRQLLRLGILLSLILLLLGGGFGIVKLVSYGIGRVAEPIEESPSTEEIELAEGIELIEPSLPTVAESPFTVSRDGQTLTLTEEIQSEYAILLDAETGKVLAEKAGREKMYPASMTKVLTLLVAVEQIRDLDSTVAITRDITDYAYLNDCSTVGYTVDETPKARELLYGTILPSGADASMGLAVLASGTQEGFVEAMNQKLAELGLSATSHFTNCIGVYGAEHYTTAEDMALLFRAAWENETCREVLATKIYTTEAMQEYPTGTTLSNWFLRRIEDRDCGGITVLGGKTGFVTQAGCCAVSYGEDSEGHGYFCVTGNSGSTWITIDDHATLYAMIAK